MYRQNKNIVFRKIHDTFFLIDITDNYMGDQCLLNEINEVGAFIWSELSNVNDIGGVVEKLKVQLNEEVEFEVLYNDVKEYIQYLLQLGLVEEYD